MKRLFWLLLAVNLEIPVDAKAWTLSTTGHKIPDQNLSGGQYRWPWGG